MNPEILANVIRGETIESIHRGHLAVVDGNRKTIASAGDPSAITYFRSAAKAFQAMPCITSGAADRYGFTEDEIAMACASHSGEKMHVERTKRMLDKIGMTEADLRCGTHLPFSTTESERMMRSGETPNQLHNNCSGKHAAMLAYAKHLDESLTDYENIEHPVQQAILKCVADFAEVAADEMAIGVDGCAAPNFATSITAMAVSFLNLVSRPAAFDEATRSACSRIVSAMINYPELIGGSERLDTKLMQAAPQKIISKVGADGVWLCGVLPADAYPTGLGIALKIEDGDDMRARPVVAVDLLRKLGIMNETDLEDLSPMLLKNRRGDTVGRVESALAI
jgi:L-asparaginase II